MIVYNVNIEIIVNLKATSTLLILQNMFLHPKPVKNSLKLNPPTGVVCINAENCIILEYKIAKGTIAKSTYMYIYMYIKGDTSRMVHLEKIGQFFQVRRSQSVLIFSILRHLCSCLASYTYRLFGKNDLKYCDITPLIIIITSKKLNGKNKF